jgi:hypothetical protein
MTAVTIDSQLNTFTLIRDILLGSTVLSAKFTRNDFFEFEENLKALNVRLPHFVIKVPVTNTDLLVINQGTTIKEFSVMILLKMDYSARSNFRTYANAVIRQIESSESLFEASGYYMPKVELSSVGDEVEDEKQLVVGQFELRLIGNVLR